MHRLSTGVTADRPDTAAVRETARQRMATLLKPKSKCESELFQKFGEVINCLNRSEFDSSTDLDIINRGNINITTNYLYVTYQLSKNALPWYLPWYILSLPAIYSRLHLEFSHLSNAELKKK